MQVIAEAQNGTEALALAAKLNPDVVVLDIHLPDISGIEVATRLVQSGTKAKIIMLSASSQQADMSAALAAGAHGYCLKSHAQTELPSLIDRLGRS